VIDKKSFKIAGDLFYTVMATLVMNVVLQIIIYPWITHFYGDNVTGEILYFMGFIYIIPQAFGTAVSNTRLVLRKNWDVANGDFTRFIVISSVLSALICGGVAVFDKGSLAFVLLYAVFSVLYFLRSYAQVEFRLTLKFKSYFLYYLLLSIGYLVGLGIYFITKQWLFIFILGECFALLYTLFKGNILKKEERKTPPKAVRNTIIMIAISTLMRDCVIQFDKVILKQTISAAVVTQYHVVSLIAKTMQMLISPVNTLIMSYLTVKGAVLSRKVLTKFTLLSMFVGAVFFGICIVGTPIYIKLLYPSLYSDIIQYNIIVNLGLIIGFLASLFMSVMLSQGQARLHTLMECLFGVCYIIAAYFAAKSCGIWGLSYVTLAVNTVKMAASLLCLYMGLKKE